MKVSILVQIIALCSLCFCDLFSGNSYSELEENNKIHLKSGSIDISSASDFANSLKNKRNSNERVQIIVSLYQENLIDPIVKICGSKGSINLSSGSYVLLCPVDQITLIQSHPSVKWIGKYENYMKTEMLGQRNERNDDNEENYVVFDILWIEEMRKEESKQLLEDLVTNLSIDAKVTEIYAKYSIISIRLNDVAQFIESVVQIQAVHRVERRFAKKPFNSKAKAITHTGVLGQTLFSKGLDGKGIVIGISDTGLDTNHCFFYDPNFEVRHCAKLSEQQCFLNNGHRKVVGYFDHADSTDADGHGTHVAGIAAANTFVQTNQKMNQNEGVAPESKIAFFDVGLGNSEYLDVPSLDEMLLVYLKQKGSSVSSHSWGTSDNAYSTDAFQTDVFTHNNPDHLVLFAAGNDGPGTSTVSGTSLSKNGISVGSSLNTVAYSISDFSSRGPSFADKRIKPDFVVPGEDILSANLGSASQGKNCDNPNQQLVSNSGTSMATPNAAGAAALVYQYYRGGFICGRNATRCGFSPSAALVKATLINSAQHFNFYEDEVTNIGATGFGRLQLNDTLDFTGKKLLFFDRQSIGSNRNFSTMVTPTGKGSLNIVLTWTDPPGSLSSGKVLINDLDLIVISPSGSWSYGNLYLGLPYTTGRDTINTVERVLIQNVENGAYTVVVRANNLNSPNQLFSLVVNLESSVKYFQKIKAVRLANGKSLREGRLEFLMGNKWLRACKSKVNISARTVCENFLGFPKSNQHFLYVQPVHPIGSNEMLQDSLSCSGKENQIQECSRSFTSNQCNPHDIVSIYCDCPLGYNWDGKTCVSNDGCQSRVFENRTSVNIVDLRWSSLSVDVPQNFQYQKIFVQTFIQHTYNGDLRIYLTHPTADIEMSIERAGAARDVFNGTIWKNSALFTPINYSFETGKVAESLRPQVAFPDSPNTVSTQGKWTLKVFDSADRDVGKITGFVLILGYNCTPIQPFVNCGSSGYYGPNCTIDFNECTLNPCPQSTRCVNTVGSYMCQNTTSNFSQQILSYDPSFFYTFDTSSTLDSSKNANHLINLNNSLVNFPSSLNVNNKGLLLSKAPVVTSKRICHGGSFSFFISFHPRQTIRYQRLFSLVRIFPNGTEIPFVSLTFSSHNVSFLNIVKDQINLGRSSSPFPLNQNYHTMFIYEKWRARAYLMVNGNISLNASVPVLLNAGDCYNVSVARGMIATIIDYASFHTRDLLNNAQQIFRSYSSS